MASVGRSAVSSEALLLPVSGSLVEPEMVAVFDSVPVAAGSMSQSTAGMRQPGNVQVGWRASTWRRCAAVGRRLVVLSCTTLPVAGSVAVVNTPAAITAARGELSPAEVKRYVDRLFHDLGTPDGGIVACGEISEDVPLENIEAMYEAFLEFKW